MSEKKHIGEVPVGEFVEIFGNLLSVQLIRDHVFLKATAEMPDADLHEAVVAHGKAVGLSCAKVLENMGIVYVGADLDIAAGPGAGALVQAIKDVILQAVSALVAAERSDPTKPAKPPTIN